MDTETAAHKLARLLETASEDDRREITAWLLDRLAVSQLSAGPDPGSWRAQPMYSVADVAGLLSSPSRVIPRRVADLVHLVDPHVDARGDQQLITVRLSVDQHARLRDWCATNKFSMAAVIRGLVERFLRDADAAPRNRRQASS